MTNKILPGVPHDSDPTGASDLHRSPDEAPGDPHAWPRHEVEGLIAGIWAQVLGVEGVGRHDSFHDLGGDSLRATQIAARIQQAWGAALPVSAIFAAPTVAGLAGLLAEGPGAPGASTPPPLGPASLPQRPPLSFCEERMWFLHQLEEGSGAYHVADAFLLEGPLEVAALARALDAVVARHEVLRTAFVAVDGALTRDVRPQLHLGLPVVDVPAGAREARQAELRRLADDCASRPFDLARPPLIRAVLLRLGESEHLLSLTLHHIVSDEWSVGVLMRELMALYRDYRAGRPGSLPPLPLQYADYACWQRGWLCDAELERQVSYWTRRLAGAPMALDLPTDRPRPPQQTYRGSREVLLLEEPFCDSLRAACRRLELTQPMLLLAAFDALLFRYTGQEDLLVGVPIANRRLPATEDLIGTFVNSVVLRTDLSGDPTLAELARRVREGMLEAYDHQDVPFDKVVEALRPARDASRSPVFQVVFNHQTVPVPWPLPAGLTSERLSVDRGAAQVDLAVLVRELPGSGLRISFEYNTDLFDRESIMRMQAHYRRLVEALVASPEERLGSVRLLDDAEREWLLFESNATAREYPEDVCVHECFQRQAARTPEAVAVVSGDERLTYGELEARAERLARRLRARGVGAEARVGICLERSVDLLVGLLAILKAGGAYVPLDPDHPAKRLAFVMADAGLALLLSERACLPRLPDFDGPLLCVDDPSDDAEAATSRRDATARSLAYLIYTSGSTGTPKGVMIEHRSLANVLHHFRDALEMHPSDSLLSVTTLGFDIAGLELFLPLIAGGRVEVVEREVAADGMRLVQKLCESRPGVMQATPATWQMLLDADWRGDPGLRALCGGEALPPLLARELLARTQSLHNVYGPTETTVWSTMKRIDDADAISIGRPIANTRIYVLDGRRQPVPVGVRGELYIAGAGVARGYWNRPDLTQERFAADPFDARPGGRMYRTGDLARTLATGDIEYLGRSDHQVKVRGFRIELGEIEAVLSQHPAVRQAVVQAREEKPGDPRLVAYLVLHEAEPVPAAAELRAFAARQLPAYMTPSASVFLQALPLTPSGKVDRRQLPAPVIGDSEAAFVAPRGDVETRLAKLWEQMLGCEAVGVRDDFFALGGHSLLAVRVCRRIEKEFGRAVSVAALLRAPTVEGLAEIVRREDDLPPGSAPVPLQPDGDAAPFFFVSGVHHFGRYLGPEQPVYRLQMQDLDRKRHFTRVEDMAAHCIESMKTVQPRGPYRIGGHCFGGVVAFEMAQQLRARGEGVALLALFDAVARGGNALEDAPGRERLWPRVQFHAGRLARIGLGPGLEQLWRGLRRKARQFVWQSAWAYGIDRGFLGAARSPKAATFRAQENYLPRLYPGRVVLFRCSQRAPWRADEAHAGWGELAAGGVEVHEIPGRHTEMYQEPQVWKLVEVLRWHLQGAQPDRAARLAPDPSAGAR